MDTEKTLAEIIRKHLGAQVRVVLFGSRAAGRATPRSDYDIGIDAGQALNFGLLERIQAEIDELPVLQKTDLVDLQRASNEFQTAIAAEQKEL